MSRRALFCGALCSPLASSPAWAFGAEGAFHPRPLELQPTDASDPRNSAAARWGWELVRRTSAPARLVPQPVRPDDPALLQEPFAIWWGSQPVRPLAQAEIRGLRQFLKLGGVLFVDDSNPEVGSFGLSVRQQLRQVLPESPVIRLPATHVLYKSYYLLDRPTGRVEGPDFVEAIRSGRNVQVVFSSHDLLGALARDAGEDSWSIPVSGGSRQREMAARLAVNLAMYVLCLDYKDDQVHAQELMRRRGRGTP